LENPKIEPKFDQYLERAYRISNSYGTVRSYLTALNKLQKFCDTKSNLPEILYELKNDKLDPVELLDDFYTYMSHQQIRNRTIIGYLSIVKDYLNFHGMHIYAEDIKQKFRTPKPDVFFEEGLTKSILNRLLQNCVPKLRVAILLACSSGMRIGEIVQLRRSDIDFTTNPVTIRVRRDTTKTRETRFTHITSEASKILNDYLTKNKTRSNADDPFLFMHLDDENDSKVYYKSMFSARQTFMEKLRKTTDAIPELTIKNENGQNSIHFHAFRSGLRHKLQLQDNLILQKP